MKTFEHEWILDEFDGHPTFRTKRMFGGLPVYLFDRQMLLLVEPTKSGRWTWHGALVVTDREHHASLRAQFPALAPHEVLGKWLFLESSHEDFEETMSGVAGCIAADDPRVGVYSKPRRAKPPKKH